MTEKILAKKCPRCGDEIKSRIEVDDFFEVNVRLFKLCVCNVCGGFGAELARLDELKQNAWVLMGQHQREALRLKRAKRSGSKTPNLAQRIAEEEQSVEELRKGLASLADKEGEIIGRRALHEQVLKERGELG